MYNIAKFNGSYKMRKRLFVVLASIVISLFLGEFLLARFYPQKTYSAAFKNAIACFDKSETVAFTLKPNCTFSFTDFDTKETFSTRTNNLGYRGNDFAIKKPDGEKRILIEGDSFILGFGVKDGDLVSQRLANLLKDTKAPRSFSQAKVINAGYAGGFGPDGYFLHLKKRGMMLEPNLVVFSVFVYNDLTDMYHDQWIGAGKFGEPVRVVSKTTKVDDGGHLVSISTPLIYKLPILRESNLAVITAQGIESMRAKIAHLYDRIRYKIKPPEVPSADATDENIPGVYFSQCIYQEICHRQVMHLFADLTTTIKASNYLASGQFTDGKPHFVVMLIPADFQLYPDTLAKYHDDGIPPDIKDQEDPNPQRRIKDILDKEKIPYIDLLPIFRKSEERLYFASEEHWNSAGHEAAADALYKWIEEKYSN